MSYLEDLVYGRKKSIFLGPVLRALAVLYNIALRIRHSCYRMRIFESRSLPCKVISVGNITLGGTGKTPMVIEIAKLLLDHKRRAVVLSRGYGRSGANDTLVVSNGGTINVDATQGGDEPVLIASKLSGLPVIVGSARYRAGLLAVKEFGADTAILDDGFQHVRLHRDVNIVLIDAEDPFGSMRLFPAGILREPLSALKRADIVVITQAEKGADLASIKKIVGRHSAARIFSAIRKPIDLLDVRTTAIKPLTSLKDASVVAFSGIARPDSFFSILKHLGADIRAALSYPDHYRFLGADRDAIIRKAADEQAEMIVTTEKDAIRLHTWEVPSIWALRIEQQIVEREEWEKMILN